MILGCLACLDHVNDTKKMVFLTQYEVRTKSTALCTIRSPLLAQKLYYILKKSDYRLRLTLLRKPFYT